jgi:hypothetical protein
MKITKTAETGVAGRMAGHAPGSGVTYDNTGGVLPPGTDNVQEAIDAILGGLLGAYLTTTLGGQGVVQPLGTLGATELIDLANANYFAGELDAADCTITTVGWTNLKDCQITVELTGDGTSTATFDGVTWIGTAPGVIGSGDVLHVVLFSRDGGTTIYGAVVGAGTSTATDGMVPYFIASGDTFTVPLYKQALKAMPITVDGTLVVDGYLIEVN